MSIVRVIIAAVGWFVAGSYRKQLARERQRRTAWQRQAKHDHNTAVHAVHANAELQARLRRYEDGRAS